MTNDQARRIAFLALRLKKERGYAFTQGASDEETKAVEHLIDVIIADHAKCWACGDTGRTEEETSGGRFLWEYCGCKIGREYRARDEAAEAERKAARS